ncbi:MAG: hypothetical protein PHW66_07925 [Gallionella sp.]|nr:hypothetical protein [Gallionella sp.]
MIRYYSFKDFLLIAIVVSIGLFVVLFLHERYEKIPVESSEPVKTVQKVNVQVSKYADSRSHSKIDAISSSRPHKCLMIGNFIYGSDRGALLANRSFSIREMKDEAESGSIVYGDFRITGIRVAAELIYRDGALFSVSGSFDPEYYGAVKKSFYRLYGEPQSENNCSVPDLEGKCNSVIWKSGGRLVMLSQLNSGMTRNNFTIMPNKNEKSSFFVPVDAESGPPVCLQE